MAALDKFLLCRFGMVATFCLRNSAIEDLFKIEITSMFIRQLMSVDKEINSLRVILQVVTYQVIYGSFKFKK